jgi:hypothetical protein
VRYWKNGRRFLTIIFLVGLSISPSKAVTDTFSEFRQRDQTWIIGNSMIQAAFQLTPDGRFRCRWIHDAGAARMWRVSDSDPGSPVYLTVDGTVLDGASNYSLQSYSFSDISTPAAGVRFSLMLSPVSTPGTIVFEADIYVGQPFLRYRTSYRNTSSVPSYITQADMLAWKFQDAGESFRDFFVNQWKWARASDFEPHETNLTDESGAVEMFTGANADHTAWRALRDSRDNGIIAAWEFDGRTRAHAEHQRDAGILKLDAQVEQLNHRVRPNGVFHVPDAFIGVYHGDWDEAGYRTQRFVENVLAVPIPDPDRFPYAMFDTWGYHENIDQATAIEAARRAAETGAEAFILDFGWARAIGDWHPDPDKFPDGLKPLSDYVHSLGMKFGLHVPFLEAAIDSPVMLEHPDWEVVDPDRDMTYFGATSLCPSHRPAREWIISELNRVIQEYDVDWLTQDGYNMVKVCDSAAHTHAEGDSNYSNAIDGLDEILRSVQQANPGVLWENCEDGGSMQTFHMVQRYVTSIVNDNADALTTRQGVYGATFPFPPRYTDRYVQDNPDNTYHTRSYMFGGPMILMNKITNWSQNTLAFAKRETMLFKFVRSTIRDGKVYHLTPQPDGTFDDAIESYDPQQDRAFIFVYGAAPGADVNHIKPRGLDPNAVYSINFLEVQHSYVANGQELMETGIPVIIRPGITEVVAVTRR